MLCDKIVKIDKIQHKKWSVEWCRENICQICLSYYCDCYCDVGRIQCMGCYHQTDNYIHTPIKGWFCQFECEEKLIIFEAINKSIIYEDDIFFYFQ
jgi:hypothetical protein